MFERITLQLIVNYMRRLSILVLAYISSVIRATNRLVRHLNRDMPQLVSLVALPFAIAGLLAPGGKIYRDRVAN